jgi:hypothetical protein
MMGDSALRLGHCTIDELVLAAGQRRRGAPMLRRVIDLLDKRSESPWESVMRVLHLAADIQSSRSTRCSTSGAAWLPVAICGSSADGRQLGNFARLHPDAQLDAICRQFSLAPARPALAER